MLRMRLPVLLWVTLPLAGLAQIQTPYQYFRVGAPQDAVAVSQAGFALMGGGRDLDEAFRWLCARAGGGDFLVLRAAGTDAYNPYIAGLEDGKSCRLNSVATLVVASREAAGDPFVADKIRHAEAVFIAGGDQANYIRFWMGTSVQTEINAAIKRGVPLGGTSAGLAVMGDWVYSAEGDKPDDADLDSKTALMDPLGPRVTLVHGFLEIPILKGIITDTHFAKRDRMGRLLVFLARIKLGHQTRIVWGLGIDEKTAVLLEPNGNARVVGEGSGYLIDPTVEPVGLETDKPLSMQPLTVERVAAGSEMNVAAKKGNRATYELSVESGVVHSSQPGGSRY